MMYGSCREILQISILLLSSVPLLYGLIVGGTEGESVTLPCTYSVKTSSDITTMCWGRGSCPNSKCTDALIYTDGHKVTYHSSDRYQLNNNIAKGQVSLTIAKAGLEDAGTYCCRVEHHGWFNDKKLNIELKMAKAVTTTQPPVRTTKTSQPPPPVKTTILPPPPARNTIPPTPPAPTTIPPTPPAKRTSPPPAQTSTPPTLATKSNTPPPPPARTTIPQPTNITTESTTVSELTYLITEFPSVVTAHDTRNKKSTDEYNSETEHVQEFQTVETVHDTRNIEPTDDKGSEMEHGHDSLTEPDTTSSVQPTSDISDNGVLDLLQGNNTVQVKKERGIFLHILIITISFLIILIVMAPLLVLKLRGKLRRQYILGLDPNLELVSHAEEPLTEAPEMDRAETDEVEARKTEDTNINNTKD